MKPLLSLLLATTMQVAALSAPNFDVEQPDYVVMVIDDHGSFMYTGTGTLIRDDIILTCQHNIRDAAPGNVSVLFKDGTKKDAIVVRSNAKHDLALLLIEPVEYETVLPGLLPPIIGDTVTVCGFPKAGPYGEVTGDIIESLSRPRGFGLDEPVIQGQSGGPVIDMMGRQVGVVWGSTKDTAYFTSLDAIHKFLMNVLDNDE